MPLLGGLLVTLFSGLASFFGLWLSKKLAIVAAALAASATLLLTLATTLSAMAAGFIASAPSDSAFMTGLYFGVPSNGAAVISVLLTAEAAAMVYRLGQQQIGRVLQA